MTEKTKEKCPHCGGGLMEKGIMNSGNSKYNIYECEKCYKEVMKCTGLVSKSRYS